MNMQTVQILVAEPAQKKMKCERTFLYTPESVNAWLEIDVGPDLPSLRSTQTLSRHKSCASTELDSDTELDVIDVEKEKEDQEKKKKEADELPDRRAIVSSSLNATGVQNMTNTFQKTNGWRS